jgi:steroid 5-alpha reductase family enzyme
MRAAITVAQMLVRLLGTVMLILGGLFWTGNALSLIPVHMLVGLVLVVTLWTLAILAAVSRVHPGLVAVAIAWGLLVPILGLTQASLLPGPAHWLIQVLHLLVGLAAIGLAETLARRGKARLPAASPRVAALSSQLSADR